MPIPAPILEAMKNEPHVNTMSVEAVRDLFVQKTKLLPPVVFSGRIEDRLVPTQERKTPIRIYTPDQTGPYPLVVYLHGGGVVFGDLDFMDGVCRYMADNAQCMVISVEYGLAPENKFPKPLEECYDVVKWISQNASDFQVNNTKIAIAGDSAGGNLSVAICLLAKQRKEFAIIQQVLIYPWLDLLNDPAVRVEENMDIPLNAGDFSWLADMYLNDPEEAKNPLASPLFAEDLDGLPPATIITEGFDPLEKEGIKFGKKLAEAGVQLAHKRFDHMIHGFVQFVNIAEEANQALDFICLQLKKAFY